jgi:xylulokinase
VTAQPSSAPGLRTFPWTATAHQVGGPTQAGADCARWCHDVFRVRGSLPEAIARGGSDLRPDAPLFLPYLAGERAPVWSGEVRGAFHRDDREHTPDDFLWSVMECVAHAERDIVAIAEEPSATRARELRACGGGAQSDAWCSLKADVLGVPVIRSRAAETGLVGAAMAAAVGLGRYRDLEEAASHMAKPGRRFRPRRRFADRYALRAAEYAALQQFALVLSGHT